MIATLLAQMPMNPSPWPTYVLFLIIALAGFLILFCIFLAKYANLWLQAWMTSASISILDLVGMSFRKVNPNIIVRSKIMAYQAGLSEKDALSNELARGMLSLQEVQAGLERFRAGAGRGGTFEDRA